jgi:hypothetical protein
MTARSAMFDDFIGDDHAWTIHYMVIDTRNWLPGCSKTRY